MRARWLKPEFFRDKKVAALGPLPALVYQALWVTADDGGVAPADPEDVHSALFSRWGAVGVPEITEALRHLFGARRIVFYQPGDDLFAFIPTFHQHQFIHKPSKFRNILDLNALEPVVPEWCRTTTSTGPALPVSRHLDTLSSRHLDTQQPFSPRDKRAARTANGKQPGGWPAALSGVWAETMGAMPPSRFGVCKAAVEQYGPDLVAKALRAYCAAAMQEGRSQYASPSVFTKTVREWVLRVTPFSKMTREEAASIGVLQDWINCGGGTELELATDPAVA